jgi:hypothetical protein
MNNIQAIFTGLYSKLSGGTALTALLPNGSAIYYDRSPDNATYPYIVMGLQSGVVEVSSAHKADNVLINISCFGTTDTQAWGIDEQVGVLLEGATLSVTGQTNFATMREMYFSRVETPPDNNSIFMSGALYRIRCD